MVNFNSITEFLEVLAEEPKGCPADDLEKLKRWIKECDLNKIQDNASEGFCKAVRKLSNSDLDNGTSFIVVLLELGLLQMVKAVLKKVQNDTGQVLDIMDAICGMSETGSKAKTILAEAFSAGFLDEVTMATNQHFSMEVVKCINLLLEQCPVNCRERLIQNSDINQKLQTLASKIYTAGDYETQVGIIECLFRFVPRKHRAQYAGQFFSDPKTAQLFLDMKDNVFETDCRTFLNTFNSELSITNKVYSYPCLTVELGAQKLKKPSDSCYTDFWVDFNAGLDRMSLFCEQNLADSQGEEGSWESVSIWKKDLRSYHLDVKKSPISLTLSLKASLEECVPVICAGQTESFALLTFNSNLAEPITKALGSCYGKDLHWTKKQELTVKASESIAPVHLKTNHSYHPQKHHDSADSEVEDRSIVNISSGKKLSDKNVSQKSRSSLYQKASVPAQPMRTPARLTFSEINKKGAAHKDSSNKSPYKSAESSDPSTHTPSKTVPKPVKHSPSVREDPSKESKSKEVSTTKTPVGKRTRSGGKVKTPLVLQSSSENVQGKQRRKRGTEKESLSESDNQEIANDKKDFDKENNSSSEKNSLTKKASISERLSIVKNALSDEETTNKAPAELPENNFIPDVITIPDSLPTENQSYTTENRALEKSECMKKFNDSGISVQDISCQEKDKSHSDKEQSDNYSPVHNLSVPEELPVESTVKESKALVDQADHHSGEISLESSVECSATFPKRTLRSRSQVNTSSPISVIEVSQAASPPQSPVETEVSFKPSTKTQKKRQKKGKAPVNPKPRSKGRNSKESKKNISASKDSLFDKEANINTLEGLYQSFSELTSNKSISRLQRPNCGKKPVYNSLSPFEKKKTKKFNLDPYEFDAETENISSSIHPIMKKENDKPKLNKIFTSKNKKKENDKINDSPVIVGNEGSPNFEPNREKCASSRNKGDQEKTCFGFDSPSKYGSPPDISKNNICSAQEKNEIDNLTGNGSAKNKSRCRVLYEEEKESFYLKGNSSARSKPKSRALKEGENQSVLTNSTNSTKRKSENYYKLFTLQKIKENVEKAGLQSPNPWCPVVPERISKSFVEKEINILSDEEEEEKIVPQRSSKSNAGRTKAGPQQKKPQKHKISIDSDSETKQDTDGSDDNIIAKFKNICKGILEDSENQRERRSRKPVTYKELSDSDVDKYETPVEVNMEDNVPPSIKSFMDADTSPAAVDTRYELSWLGSQRKRKKKPMKTYKHKNSHKSRNFDTFSAEFNFKSICTSGGRDYPTLADITRTLSGLQSTMDTTDEETKKIPSSTSLDDDDDESDHPGDVKTDPIRDLGSKELIVSITPLNLTLDNYDYDDDKEDMCLSPNGKKQKKMLEFDKESSDEKDDDEMITAKLLSSCVSGKSTSKNLDISIGSPVLEDPWNVDYESLTPAIPILSPQGEDSVSRFKGTGAKTQGFVSGPSSTKRLTKSAVKRKYPDLDKNNSEEEDNESDDPEEEIQNLSQNSTGSLQPRKLFRAERKTGSYERSTISSFEETTSRRSLCSEESVSQADFGDISIQKGVSTFIQTFGLDVKNQIKEKRRRLDQLTKGATKATQQHLNAIWLQQSENRSRLMGKLKDSMLLELIELEKDVTRLKDAEEQTVDTFKRQLSVIQNCRKSQEQRLKNLKRLHHGYGKSVEEMDVTEKLQQVTVKDNLKAELASLHQKLLRDSQQQEMGKFRRNLKNLF